MNTILKRRTILKYIPLLLIPIPKQRCDADEIERRWNRGEDIIGEHFIVTRPIYLNCSGNRQQMFCNNTLIGAGIAF